MMLPLSKTATSKQEAQQSRETSVVDKHYAVAWFLCTTITWTLTYFQIGLSNKAIFLKKSVTLVNAMSECA